MDVSVGDYLLAYLPHNQFFAVGKICKPRKVTHAARNNVRKDLVTRTTRQHSHLFLDGIVQYADAPTFYEDFTDRWSLPVTPRSKDRPS
jgi:hypothetical protein